MRRRIDAGLKEAASSSRAQTEAALARVVAAERETLQTALASQSEALAVAVAAKTVDAVQSAAVASGEQTQIAVREAPAPPSPPSGWWRYPSTEWSWQSTWQWAQQLATGTAATINALDMQRGTDAACVLLVGVAAGVMLAAR